MTLIKTSLLNAIAVTVKMLTMLGINKILAMYVGPAGYAALGQFQNAMHMLTTFASGAINNGVTKYTAEHHENEEHQRAIWRTAGTIALIGSLFTASLIFIFNRPLAGWFLKDETMGGVFIWFAATLILFVFNTLLLAILNGKQEIQRFFIANLAGSLFALIVVTIMTVRLGLYGALVAMATYQSLSFFVTLFVTYKAPWFKLKYLIGAIDKKIALNLFKYSLMILVTVMCGPTATIFVRDHLISVFGLEYGGYWEAMSRISSAYLMLFTSILTVYFLPKLSELKKVDQIKKEIFNGWKFIVPVAFFIAATIYFLRNFVIFILFTPEFQPMGQLFIWEMIGNVLRIASWILSFIMLSKALMKLYILTEIGFNCSYYFVVLLMTEIFGFTGSTIAHAVNSLIYLLFLIYTFFFSKKYAFDKNPRIYE